MARFTEDLYVEGNITAVSFGLPADSITNASINSAAAIARTKLAQDQLKPFIVPMTDFRIWDAFTTNLPATSATDDLGLYSGTFGTASPTIQTGDVKNTTVAARYARVQVKLPAEYDGGETVTLRLYAGMITTVASSLATVDVECYKSNKASGISADLCTTSAISINSLTFANRDFTITPTTLSPGDILDIRITIAVTDSATGTAVIAAIGSVELLCDIRG